MGPLSIGLTVKGGPISCNKAINMIYVRDYADGRIGCVPVAFHLIHTPLPSGKFWVEIVCSPHIAGVSASHSA